MTDFIIEEDIVNKICAILINAGENRLANKLCSRPHPAPDYKEVCLARNERLCETEGVKTICCTCEISGNCADECAFSEQHDAAIAHIAREQVLQQVIDYCNKEAKENPDDEAWYDSTMEKVADYCESLRSQQQGGGHP